MDKKYREILLKFFIILVVWCVMSLLLGLNCSDELPTPPPDPVDTNIVLILSPPFGVVAEADTNYNITLRWQDTTKYQPNYVVERGDTVGDFTAIDTIPAKPKSYIDTLPKKAHATFRYRLFSYYDTLVSKLTDTVTAFLPNNPPVLEITNYDALTNKVFMLGDSVPITFAITDSDTDTVIITNPDSQVVFKSDSLATFYISDTLPDTLQFIAYDFYGGSDSATVVIRYFDVNYGPVFERVSPPDLGVVGKKASCGYKVTDPDNDAISLYVDSVIAPNEDPRDVKILLEDSIFTFTLLPHDTGNTAFTFIAEDVHQIRDTLIDTFLIVTSSMIVYNTIQYDTVNRLAWYEIDGTNGRFIAEGHDSIGYPVVSPSNGKLVYTKDIEDYREIHSMNIDGTWDQTLFTDTNNVYIPGSWSSDSAAVAFRMLVTDSSKWSIVIYDIGTGNLDTVYSGIPIRGEAYGPIYTTDGSVFIISNNDTLYSLSLSQGMTAIAFGASHPQVLHASAALYYASTVGGSKLVKAGLSGQGAVVVADFTDFSVDYIAVDQTRQIVYGLAIKGSGVTAQTYAWAYFEKYNKFVKMRLEIEESL